MPRVYELPTHLQIEDTLAFGLTPRQLLRLLVGASLAYTTWDQTLILPLPLRLALVTGLSLVGLLLALLQPGGRPLDQWLLAAVVFALLPRRLVWRLDRPVAPAPRTEAKGHDWAELRPSPIGSDQTPQPNPRSTSKPFLLTASDEGGHARHRCRPGPLRPGGPRGWHRALRLGKGAWRRVSQILF